jgi:hypothetical protein
MREAQETIKHDPSLTTAHGGRLETALRDLAVVIEQHGSQLETLAGRLRPALATIKQPLPSGIADAGQMIPVSNDSDIVNEIYSLADIVKAHVQRVDDWLEYLQI